MAYNVDFSDPLIHKETKVYESKVPQDRDMPALSVEVADGGVDGEYFVSISNITVTMYLTVASRGVNIRDLHCSLNVIQLRVIHSEYKLQIGNKV